VEIEVRAGWIAKQGRCGLADQQTTNAGGEQDNECERDSTIADANHDDRVDAEYKERADLTQGRGFRPFRTL